VLTKTVNLTTGILNTLNCHNLYNKQDNQFKFSENVAISNA